MKTNVLQMDHDREIAHAERFAFRKNWFNLPKTLYVERNREADQSFRYMLSVPDLHGRTFLDIGFGRSVHRCHGKHGGVSQKKEGGVGELSGTEEA